jgi:hypothetical protein
MSKSTLGTIGGLMALVGGSITAYLGGLPVDDPINWLVVGGSIIVAVIGFFQK